MSYLFGAIRWDVVAMVEEEDMYKLLLYIPYELLIETEGGNNHAIITLQNKLAIFTMLLLTSVDKLIVICGCPGLFYINTAEKKKCHLSISALQISPFI